MQKNSEALIGLVVGRKGDGRCQYDPQVKAELVRQSMQPGVSVSRMAMLHGVNANLLRVWIAKAQSSNAILAQRVQPKKASTVAPAFVPVQLQASVPTTAVTVPAKTPEAPGAKASATIHMQVRLPNGIDLSIDTARANELIPVLQILSTLPCSN